MTCISAVVKNGHVYMAGDLMGSNGFTKKVYPDTKVFKNGDFLIGYTSSFRMGQILQYNWSQPPRLEGVTDREYLQIDVIESMRECFNNYGFGEFKDGEHQGGTFLIGYKGELYEMQSNFSILKNESFAAVGSGQYHAEAVLLLLTQDPDFDPQDVLTASIYAASYFTTSVSEDCTIVTTDDAYEKSLEEDEKDNTVEKDTSQSADVIRFGLPDDSLWIDVLKSGEFITSKFQEFAPMISFYDRSFTLADLKDYADILDVPYPHNIGKGKLVDKLDLRVQEIVRDLNK